MIWGTSYFISRAAAERYYASYEDNAARAVSRKLANGEIHIGEPPLEPGQFASIIRGEGRYQIEDASK